MEAETPKMGPLILNHGNMEVSQPAQPETMQEAIDQRLDRYDYYRIMINHPTEGMRAKGFTEAQVKAALEQCDLMQDFYEDLVDEL